MQIWTLFGHDRSLHRADLKADAAVNAGLEVNPIEGGALAVCLLAWVNAGDWAGIDAISNALAHIGDDGVGH